MTKAEGHYHTQDSRGHEFKVNPKVCRGVRGGWVISAYCTDRSLYGGLYTAEVGFAYENVEGRYGWRLKRDAIRAMNTALAAGILRLEDRT